MNEKIKKLLYKVKLCNIEIEKKESLKQRYTTNIISNGLKEVIIDMGKISLGDIPHATNSLINKIKKL